MRVEAELAEEARARFDQPAEQEAQTRAADVAARIAGEVAATSPGTPAPELVLYAELCAAELTRAAHAPDPAAWAAPIARADALADPGRRRLRPPAPGRGRPRARAAPPRRRTAARRRGHRRPARRPAAAGRDPARWRSAAASTSARPRTRPPRTTSTSPHRERDVLRLIAAGRTNREIGAELFISPKTASVHVSHILRKLGVRGRVEAAAFAHRRGLDG